MSRTRLLLAVTFLVSVAVFVDASAAPAQPIDARATADPLRARYLHGRALSSEGRLEEAASELASVVGENAKHQVVGDAAILLLDVLNRLGTERGDYSELRGWVLRLVANSVLLDAHPKLAKVVRALHMQVLRKDAEAFDRDKKFTASGEAYLAIYRTYPRAPHGDELLYNAASSFRAAHSVGLALTVLAMIGKRYPRSRLAAKALRSRAELYRSIAYFHEAGKLYAQYARQYPGNADSADALSISIGLRFALGSASEASEARKLAALYVKAYGRKQKRRASRLVFAVIEAPSDKPGAVIARLRNYIKRWTRAGDPESLVVAHARLGELFWNHSCPAIDEGTGACVKRVQLNRKGRCAGGVRYRVVRRNQSDVIAARLEFQRALALQQRNTDRASLAGSVASAQARFFLLDQEFEKFIAMEVPRDLDFGRGKAKKASILRFTEWLERRGALAKALVFPGKGGYRVLAAEGSSAGPWAGASMARIAAVYSSFAADLRTMQIPRDLRRGKYAVDKTRAFCDQLNQNATSMEQLAIEALSACLTGSAPESSSRQWRGRCQRSLENQWPKRFPVVREHHGRAGTLAPILSLEGPR